MSSNAAKVALITLDEISENAFLRENSTSFLVKNAAHLQPCITGQTRREFDEIMKYRTTDSSRSHQGSVILIGGVLEAFFAKIIDDYLLTLNSKLSKLDSSSKEAILDTYAVQAGNALQHLKTGTFLGVNFDFNRLKRALATTFSNDQNYDLRGDVFTVRFGTCKSEKIESLFNQVGLSGPFDKDLGANKAVAKWAKDRSPTSAANYLREMLDDLGDLRNDLAHGHPTNSISHDLVKQHVAMSKVLVQAINERLFPENIEGE
ncbi:HEPN domain-containing protein [Erythrobacter aureus]|uniref:HEPN domain-containing protein n=1 Tax=Erythrobacter aureus TaxID=2182384 RepID=UPI003A8E3DC7